MVALEGRIKLELHAIGLLDDEGNHSFLLSFINKRNELLTNNQPNELINNQQTNNRYIRERG